MVGRRMFGIFLDVTERKLAEEDREMLAGEMSHRVKNLFAIAAALTQIASRSAATPKDMALDVAQRLIALGGSPRACAPHAREPEKGGQPRQATCRSAGRI
jgi:two-component sensor histidine kinase